MTSLNKTNSQSKELESLLLLRTVPLAIKLLEREEDIHREAIRPKRDRIVIHQFLF